MRPRPRRHPLLLTWLLACTAAACQESDRDPETVAEADGQDDTRFGGNSGTEGGHQFPSQAGVASGMECYQERWDGPDEPLERYRCVPWFGEGGGAPADDMAPPPQTLRPGGSPTESSHEGPWICDCAGEVLVTEDPDTPDAGTPAGPWIDACHDAMLELCGVAGLVPPSHCRAAAGGCWPEGDGEFSCRCGIATDTSLPLTSVRAAGCEVALVNTCESSCDGALGACTPSGDTERVLYACDCASYGPVERFPTRTCPDIVEAACDPTWDGGALGCNSHTGYCDGVALGFDCQCLDGASALVTVARDAEGCRQALVDTCGQGEAPGGCDATLGDVEGGCDSLGGGVYRCSCSLPQTPSQMTCEPESGQTCGSPGSGPQIRDVDLLADNCEQALVLSGPELAQDEGDVRAHACEDLEGCQALAEPERCAMDIAPACVACLQAADAARSSCDALTSSCARLCGPLTAAPSTVEQCSAAVSGYEPAAAQCLCEQCLDGFAACTTNPGCAEILACVDRTWCEGEGCFAPETCRDALETWGITDAAGAAALTAFVQCGRDAGCLQTP